MELFVILFATYCGYLWIENKVAKEKIIEEQEKKEKKTKEKEQREKAKQVEKEKTERLRQEAEERARVTARETEVISDDSAVYVSEKRRSTNPFYPTLDTGIEGLDGPGVFQKLHESLQAYALYLLYSQTHNAYKVGISSPKRLYERIRRVQRDVPDVVLSGLTVKSSKQRAFEAEQEVLNKYRNYRYTGIYGRSSGGTEWITERPTGRPRFTPPARIEQLFNEMIETNDELEIPDNFTVYLMYSKSKNMYRCSWCKTTNLPKKIKDQQKSYSSDVVVVSRFKIETLYKARGIAVENNSIDFGFKKEGRKEIFHWISNPDYLDSFESWDEDGNKI